MVNYYKCYLHYTFLGNDRKLTHVTKANVVVFGHKLVDFSCLKDNFSYFAISGIFLPHLVLWTVFTILIFFSLYFPWLQEMKHVIYTYDYYFVENEASCWIFLQNVGKYTHMSTSIVSIELVLDFFPVFQNTSNIWQQWLEILRGNKIWQCLN